MIPRLSRVGILSGFGAFKDYEDAARSLKVPLQILEVQAPTADLPRLFQVAVKERVSAIITTSVPSLSVHRKQIADLALQHQLPLMSESVTVVEDGGLASYDAHRDEIYRRAAFYVDKILKGAKPADLPIEQASKFEMVINLKTAKQIGVTIPPNVLAQSGQGNQVRPSRVIQFGLAAMLLSLTFSAAAQQPQRVPLIRVCVYR